jgi:hypothetical protein
MNISKTVIQKCVKELCQPSYIYFVLSLFSLILMLIQNCSSKKKHKYCVGIFECNVKSIIPIFIVKLMYVVFWTFILDLLCKNGYKKLSWLILLFPFITFFILIGLFILYNLQN